jgi:predicted DCC family thiol-disulfide oxidoreductase YuxK
MFIEQETSNSAGAVLVFDGFCGFCTKMVYLIKRFDNKNQLQFIAWQSSGTLKRFELTVQDVKHAAWFINTDERESGAGAINAALSLVFGTRIFKFFYFLPGIRQTQDAAYRWIEQNRKRLPGVVPYCKQAGSNCVSKS